VSLEVIVSTHANAPALDLCLRALAGQGIDDLRVCVAEDGECPRTRAVVEAASSAFAAGRLRHVRQPHQGFRKNRILNEAIRTSDADYLVFVDGDCVALPGFLARHLEARRPACFLSGGVIRLTQAETDRLLAGRAGVARPGPGSAWRWANGPFRLLKSGCLPLWLAALLETASPTHRTWNGGNSSAWRRDVLAVNGFDESLGYGADDVDLGFRLNAMGVAGRHVRYSAGLLHLEHARAQSDVGVRVSNASLARRRRGAREPWAVNGIRRG
jgi:GT2 family glycosyltransferase